MGWNQYYELGFRNSRITLNFFLELINEPDTNTNGGYCYYDLNGNVDFNIENKLHLNSLDYLLKKNLISKLYLQNNQNNNSPVTLLLQDSENSDVKSTRKSLILNLALKDTTRNKKYLFSFNKYSSIKAYLKNCSYFKEIPIKILENSDGFGISGEENNTEVYKNKMSLMDWKGRNEHHIYKKIKSYKKDNCEEIISFLYDDACLSSGISKAEWLNFKISIAIVIQKGIKNIEKARKEMEYYGIPTDIIENIEILKKYRSYVSYLLSCYRDEQFRGSHKTQEETLNLVINKLKEANKLTLIYHRFISFLFH